MSPRCPPGCPVSAGGYLAHSLAILTDAAHLLTDFASIMISLFALWVSSRPPTKTMNFGWHRAGNAVARPRACHWSTPGRPPRVAQGLWGALRGLGSPGEVLALRTRQGRGAASPEQGASRGWVLGTHTVPSTAGDGAGGGTAVRQRRGGLSAEILGALLSVLSIWVVTGVLVYLGAQRLLSGDYDIEGGVMLITSACAVAVNIV